MRRLLVFLMIFSVITTSLYYPPVKAASSVDSVLTLNLNVTVVNTAPVSEVPCFEPLLRYYRLSLK